MGALITRLRLRNYKSIASCDVALNDLSVLVGLNGAGKSNFLDAFAFISDACNNTLDAALRNRGGIGAVRRKSGGHPNNFGMSFFLNLDEERNAFYAFEISALPGEKFEVRKEVASVSDPDPSKAYEYRVARGHIDSMTNIGVTPDIRPDRLFLTSVAGLKPFDQLFDAMSSLAVYDINPDEFRLPQPHDSGDLLSQSGHNIASVLRELGSEAPIIYDRMCEYIKRIVVGIERVEVKSLGPTETIQFFQNVQGGSAPWKFDALNMSSGTLRSLGVLTALFHQQARSDQRVPFAGIEEPEGTIHPAAAAVIMEAILEASKYCQIVFTTHSPELLDHPGVQDDNLLVVTSERNETTIGHADEASRSAMRQSLMTAGELLRTNQLVASKKEKSSLSQADLFAR